MCDPNLNFFKSGFDQSIVVGIICSTRFRVIEVETVRAKPRVGHVRARCKVAGKLVAEAELKFTLVDA